MLYTYFKHVRRPECRIVIQRGDPIPVGLDPTVWEKAEERSEDRVHSAILKAIEQFGFGSWMGGISLEELDEH